MDKKVLDYVIEQTNALIKAPTCSKEAKTAAQSWLKAVGTDHEADETKRYITELEADIMPIDTLISIAGSDAGVKVFGAELANKIAAHAKDIKAKGAQFCDCPACTVAAVILAKKDQII